MLISVHVSPFFPRMLKEFRCADDITSHHRPINSEDKLERWLKKNGKKFIDEHTFLHVSLQQQQQQQEVGGESMLKKTQTGSRSQGQYLINVRLILINSGPSKHQLFLNRLQEEEEVKGGGGSTARHADHSDCPEFTLISSPPFSSSPSIPQLLLFSLLSGRESVRGWGV